MNKFTKIKEHIYHKIESGEWPENHPVSSENALCTQFSVSRMTARRALQELADEAVSDTYSRLWHLCSAYQVANVIYGHS